MKKNHTMVFFVILFMCMQIGLFAQHKTSFGTKDGIPTKEKSTPIIPVLTQGSSFLEDFNGDNTTAGITARDWVWVNADGGGTSSTFNGITAVFNAYEGPTNGYIGQNWQGANGLLIDQWLISPELTVEAGDTLSFYWLAGGGVWDDSVYIKISEGGSAVGDFTLNVGRYKVPAGAWTNYTYVFATGGTKRVAFHYYHTDANTHSNYWGLDYFQILSTPCIVDASSNPSPANEAEDIPVNLSEITWTNPGSATSNEVFWGTNPATLSSVQSGTQSSFSLPSLDYSTTYYWRVDESNATCTTPGPVWSFTTEANPNLYIIFFDDFEASTDTVPVNWTVTNNGGTRVWTVYNTPWPNTYTLPAPAGGKVLVADSDNFGAGSTTANTTVTITNPLDLSLYQIVALEFDSDYRIFSGPESASVEVSNNGTDWVEYLAYDGSVSDRNRHVALDITATAALQSTIWVRLTYISAWDWWWAVDNIKVVGSSIIPVELTSFAANVINGNITLNWVTATETNNKGFEVERKSGEAYTTVGFIDGKGTTTETNSYSFIDAKIASGKYSYRLKQVDFGGTFEYSNVVEVEVLAPSVYNLSQNYPNPFNPATKINYSLAADAKVKITIFDALGQEIVTLVNGTMPAGNHEANFNASSINSGVYFYRIDAQGIDGSNYSSVKKMILTK